MLQGVVDVLQGGVALAKGDSEEGVFVSIVGNRFAEAYVKEGRPSYHEVEGCEVCVGLLASVVGCPMFVGSMLIGIAQAHVG